MTLSQPEIDYSTLEPEALHLLLIIVVEMSERASPGLLRYAPHHTPNDIIGEMIDMETHEVSKMARWQWRRNVHHFLTHHGWIASLAPEQMRDALGLYDRLQARIQEVGE